MVSGELSCWHLQLHGFMVSAELSCWYLQLHGFMVSGELSCWHLQLHGVPCKPWMAAWMTLGYTTLMMYHIDRHRAPDRGNHQTPKNHQLQRKPFSGGSAGVCKHWGSSAGCLKGDKCTYAHDWNNLNDKDKRCWKCSGLEHMAKDCTAGEKSTASPGDKSSKGSPKGKGKSKDGKNDKGKGKGRDKPAGGVDQSSKDSQPQVAQMQQPQAQQGQQQATVTPASEQSQQAQPSVIGEVASLLKTMRTTSTTPRVLAVMVDNNQGVLLDSGATHILRGPYDESEWMQDAVENVKSE
eukprot:s2011_g7.t1